MDAGTASRIADANKSGRTLSRGCYEMLMVLAEAVAQPLPGESPTWQAREALQILERAARCSASRLMPIT